MTEYFRWASAQFNDFVILLMDDPDLHNLKVFKSLDHTQALDKARNISETIKSGYERTLAAEKITNIKVVQFKDFQEDPTYKKTLQRVTDTMSSNTDFRHSLYNLMETNIGKRIAEFCAEKNLDEAACANTRDMLIQYIIEELASLVYFTEKGYVIELDPTEEFETKKYIYEGSFPQFTAQLPVHERGHIFVYPEGTSYHKKTYEE